MIFRRISYFLEAEKNLNTPSFLQPNVEAKIAIGACKFHCTPVVQDQFFKFVKKSRSAKADKDLSHTYLKEVLQNCKSVSDQWDAFHSYVQLTPEDVSRRQNTCHEIEDILKRVFAKSSLKIIGSTVTGLGLKGCDLDLSFQTSDCDSLLDTPELGESIVMTKDIIDGKVPVSTFPQLNPKQKLHFLNRILKESNVAGTIIPGHCPILSFPYNGFDVDLGINNISGIQGTNFMKLCGKLDSRVAPLFRCITYWAKHYKLCGGAMKFKSYGLFLLLVFFLQARGVLPTVEVMLQKAGLQETKSWLYESSHPKLSTEELLQEFFFCYANFDFSYVICTSTCELIKGDEFVKKSKNENFELNSISIQDPLNPDWNVTRTVNWKHCRHFAAELLSACEIFQEKWNPSPNSGPFGLLALIDTPFTSKDLKNTKMVNINIHVSSPEDGQAKSRKVYEMFRDGLGFQCDKLQQSGLQDEGTTLVSRFQCVASDTWFGRSSFEFMHRNDDVGFWAKELQISKHMTSMEKSERRTDFEFLCECRIQDGCLHVMIKPEDSEIFIPKLAIFLKHYILKCIDK
ncbi:hypothetical protein JTE90_006458 [Oedothorax gibbosus]|uniref:PAP-associated domain-containing protein n=1 Tax=Oedothorax gibbosus TaxID=931172 RepID=A0AAV6UFQ7_9ARAC|nr:hypothetical protein JTE90_006458 [Oedothorax gibbosus]